MDKVAAVRSGIIPSSSPLPVCPIQQSTLSVFQPISLRDLGKLFSTTKSSSGPFRCFYRPCLKRSLQVPTYFKQAVVQPLLSNLTSISKLPFISKLLEKVLACQLAVALNNNNILDKFQSGFCQRHSTETALLRVWNDIMMSSDAVKCSILVLLDLSSLWHCRSLHSARQAQRVGWHLWDCSWLVLLLSFW